jgi:hypothetical protein
VLLCASVLALSVAPNVTAAPNAPTELVVATDGGAPFSTIAGAVAVASPGSVIRIRPGLYRETVVVDKNLTLIGAEGSSPSVLDGEERRPLLRVIGPAVLRCEYLELRQGNATSGPAAHVSGGAVADFLHCTFLDNLAREHDGAVSVVGEGSWAEFVDCHFQRNRAAGDGGALGARDGGEVTLRQCTFYLNRAGGDCGAVDVAADRALVIEQCLFIENEGLMAGALRTAGGAVHLEGNTFFRNVSLGGASVHVALRTPSALVSVTRNIFCGDQEGAGLALPPRSERACNLYYDNFRGALLAGEPSADELQTNPEFCDFRGLDLTLRHGSPAAGDSPGCGRIGALDVGCVQRLEAASWLGPSAPQRRVR